MGCDIHMMAEVRKNGKWRAVGKVFKNPYYKPDGPASKWNTEYIAEPYDGRNYRLFGFLANVRNGYGFAGVDTGDAIRPIALPRGVPEDASREWKKQVDYWDVDMHSMSWFTLRELQEADWDQEVVIRGVVPAEVYEKVKDDLPESWSSWITGPNIQIVSGKDWSDPAFKKEPEVRYYVHCEWRKPLRHLTGGFLEETMPALANLGEPDDVRIVFGFDN